MRPCWFLSFLLLATSVDAEPVTVGVASNFIAPMGELVSAFEQATGHVVQVSSASTGVLYAAARNGARYAALLAADSERPRRLEEEGIAVAGTRFTYAVGSLVLWSADPRLAGSDCRSALDDLGALLVLETPAQNQPLPGAGQRHIQHAQLLGHRAAGLARKLGLTPRRAAAPARRWPSASRTRGCLRRR